MSAPLALGGRNPVAHHIGTRIRACRKELGISLSELSRRSGIAKGTLSRLESGQGNPTVMTLATLAGILKVTPSDFIGGGTTAVPAAPPVLEGPGIEMQFLHRTVGEAVWEVYETVIPMRPEPIHSATHGGIEHLIMIEGEAEVGPSEAPVRLTSGRHTAFAGNRPHLYWSPSGPSRVLLMMEYPLGEAGSDGPSDDPDQNRPAPG